MRSTEEQTRDATEPAQFPSDGTLARIAVALERIAAVLEAKQAADLEAERLLAVKLREHSDHDWPRFLP